LQTHHSLGYITRNFNVNKPYIDYCYGVLCQGSGNYASPCKCYYFTRPPVALEIVFAI